MFLYHVTLRCSRFNVKSRVFPSAEIKVSERWRCECKDTVGLESQFLFDDQIFRNIRDGKGVIKSDSVLYQDNDMKNIIDSYLARNESSEANFAADFAEAVVKMGAIGVKTNVEGEIRRICNATN
ncbi:heme peroxidase protein [Raphanus sativus]|nr:heme peroxidase protein [Raphanus sativus]